MTDDVNDVRTFNLFDLDLKNTFSPTHFGSHGFCPRRLKLSMEGECVTVCTCERMNAWMSVCICLHLLHTFARLLGINHILKLLNDVHTESFPVFSDGAHGNMII